MTTKICLRRAQERYHVILLAIFGGTLIVAILGAFFSDEPAGDPYFGDWLD